MGSNYTVFRCVSVGYVIESKTRGRTPNGNAAQRQEGKKTMRKSNSKETRRAVEAYVIETIEDHTDRDEPKTARPVSRFYDILRDEMSFQSYRNGDREILGAGLAKKYRSAGRYGFVAATRPYWVWYLAVFQGEFIGYTGDAYDNLKLWLDETEEEAERYNADQAWHMYAHLTAQAFERLYNKEQRSK